MKPPTVDRQSSIPLSTQIADWYKTNIDNSSIATGEELPSIRTIANAVGTSSTTVKRALDNLQVSGYLARSNRGKLIVASNGTQQEPTRTRWQVFWSYARADDEKTHGAVSTLMQRICDEYQVTTGNKLGVFQDVKDIAWGNNWGQVIENNLTSTVFFIPILSPTYLRRSNCVNELGTAIATLREAGIEDGIFPILFADIGSALNNFPDQQIKQFISNHQYVDCSHIRRLSPDSPEYISKVGEIVDDMVAMQPLLDNNQNILDSRVAENRGDDSLGLLEKISMLEESAPAMEEISQQFNIDTKEIADLFVGSTEEINAIATGPRTTATKIMICKKLAHDLERPVENFYQHSSDFVDKVRQFDIGIKALPEMYHLNQGDINAIDVVSFNSTVDSLLDSSRCMLQSVKDFRKVSEQIGNLSRDLRPLLASLRESCDLILDLETVFDSWEELRSYTII